MTGNNETPPKRGPETSLGGDTTNDSSQVPNGKPTLHPEARYGLAGEVVGMFEPHTEADPAAILATFLAAFGNAVGPGPYIVADGARHAARLCPVLVGVTSRGRKGTAQANINWLMGHADSHWFGERMVSGLASGEGLIAALEPDDQGRVTDPRLFIVEPEFARVLKAAGREGSVLSAVLRDAWDRGDLSNMTRHSPLKVKGAHITVVAHITVPELHRQLTETEAANGFANRFLFFEVGRAQRLPHGGTLDDSDVAALGFRVGQALSEARKIGKLRRSAEADRLWETAYYAVDDNVPGMLGAVLARTEAQLLRLSMVYALLDGSPIIKAEHLRAAAAVWDYTAISAGRIFGHLSGDPIADELLAALRNAGDAGLDRTAQHNLFSRHVSVARREAALEYLTERRLVETVTIETGGRPRTVTRIAQQAQKAQKVPGITDGHPLTALLALTAHDGDLPDPYGPK